jgi:hypothetical protein
MMDHSNCSNSEECELYERYAHFMDDPDHWTAKRRDQCSLDSTISVRLNSAQLKVIHEAAKVRNMTISCFIRETALKAASLPYVHIIGFPVSSTNTV